MQRAIGLFLPTYILDMWVLAASLDVVDGVAKYGVCLRDGIEIENSRLS